MSALLWRRLLAWLSEGQPPPDIVAISPEQAKELLSLRCPDPDAAIVATPVTRKELPDARSTRFARG